MGIYMSDPDGSIRCPDLFPQNMASKRSIFNLQFSKWQTKQLATRPLVIAKKSVKI